MYLLNLSLGQFLALLGSVSALMIALYLLDRSRRRQVVSTLRFWVAAEQPPVITRRRRIQQPLSLILQLVSMTLLLLAIAQLRLGSQAGAPRDHVVILETSAWMAAQPATKTGVTLMEAAKERARAYVRSVPARDRVMLVRADALATPATSFEPNRRTVERAINESRPGSTALNLDQAFSFARQLQAQGGRRGGEIVFIGTGRIAARDAAASQAPTPKNLRYIPIADPVDNCGLRKIGVRRSTSDPELWEIYVSARNYSATPRTVTLALGFGASTAGAASVPVAARRIVLPPGAEREASFEYRTRAAGVLEARLLPHDSFPDDDRAAIELPSQELLHVTVYSDQPELLRPVFAANPRVAAVFRKASEPPAAEDGLLIFDRVRPPTRPKLDSIWIDPPADGSPIPVRARKSDVPFARWNSDNLLGAGLRTKDFHLASVSVFETAPEDVKIGEIESGAVIVAREGKPKTVVLGFHPALSAIRYELATPLLFANILRWVAPQIFRRWELSAGSVGTVKVALDPDVKPSDVRVLQEDGKPAPFTLRDRTVHFFAGAQGTMRVLAGDREYVYSLTLPQLWESRWEPPGDVRRGIPKLRVAASDYTELWHWLALLGAAGLIAEWVLYGRLSRGVARAVKPLVKMKRAS
jgi:hypothetical protein